MIDRVRAENNNARRPDGKTRMNHDIPSNYPQLSADEVVFQWHMDFWDGPLTGMCLYQGQEYWYHCFDENSEDSGWCRRFSLHSLSEQDIADEKYWHELFREKVGTHWEGGSLQPRELHNEFYDAYLNCADPHYELNRPIIGWMEL